MAVFEDPDELGYYSRQEAAKGWSWRKFLGVPRSSLDECNAILSAEEQAEIAHVAHLMENGYAAEAERHRVVAGYDSRTMQIAPDSPVR